MILKEIVIDSLMRFTIPSMSLMLLGFWACTDKGVSPDESPCLPIDIVSTPPYDSPIWHPSGQYIGFNYTPLESIDYPFGQHCQGQYRWKSDSAGFWLVNMDGTNKRRIFPYKLQTPAWSPDGEWIVFGAGAQIFKMRFTGTGFDTTTLVQLTNQGRNFFPAWSPDGQWIAYNKSVCEGPSSCGIWLMTSAGTQNRFLADYGNYPAWHPSTQSVSFFTREVNGAGQAIGDRLWSFHLSSNSAQPGPLLTGQNIDNRHPRYSPDGTQLAFWSSGDIWMMDINGTNLHKLTQQRTKDWLDWSRDGKEIAYVNYRPDDWTYSNGVLWVLSAGTHQTRQLTFNP